MVTASSASTSLKEYLKRYESTTEVDKKKKKKRKVKTGGADATGVIVVDEDPVWQKQVKLDEEENDESADEEKPQIDEDIEVKRMKRLEQLKARRPFGVISEDGSGWVSLSDAPKNSYIRDQESDMSPPRRTTRNDSPPPGSDSRPSTTGSVDLSPPRKQRFRNDTPSPEPAKQFSSRVDADLSPPRKQGVRHDSASPQRGKNGSGTSPAGDLSPPRKIRRERSPPLSRRSVSEIDAAVSDLSPPRRRQKGSHVTSERPKTGLVTGRDVKDEVTKAKKEEWLRFKELDPSVSGRGAEAVYRDKITGKAMSKEEVLKSQKKEKEEKPKEIKLEWGKGLAQKREAEAKLKELELEKEKPFARSRDDPDLDRMLKDRLRWGDPMAHLVKKKHLEPVLPDFGDDEKVKESGFIIPQEIPSHSWIRRGVDAPPNRYGIKPGRHWDGVDRSNGFEKEFFKRMNEKQATEREAYMWSVADM